MIVYIKNKIKRCIKYLVLYLIDPLAVINYLYRLRVT